MLSIGAMKGGQQGYYLDLAREDYYLNGGEPPGIWHGQGAADLGLSGVVEGEALTRLFEGYHPTEDRSLIQQQRYKNREHQPGWDLTFSAPKSVSVLWSQADAVTRKTLQQSHFAAVKAALDYLEDEVAVTRKGKGGAEKVQARLVIATFEHHTSRAQDPQLHTHALVMNACTDEDGKSGTLESKGLYQAKMAAGALYRAELAAQLERQLHLTIERKGSVFEIKGVSEPLIAEMSKRRAEIEKALAEGGYTSAAAAEIAAFSTRQTKGHVAQEALTEKWHETGRAFGWGPEQAAQLLKETQPKHREPAHERKQPLEKTAERLTENQSFFTRRDFTRFLAESSQGRGFDAREVRAARDAYLNRSPDIVRLGNYRGEWVYTTPEIIKEEKTLLAGVERSKERTQQGVSSQTVEGVIATRRQISEEQSNALRHITTEGGSIRIVSGMAGTGKTTLLHAARLSWELEGYEVYGAALSGKAAEGLSQGAMIKSETLRKTLWDLKHDRIRLHEKSVLVVDEAGMVGTKMMRQLVEQTERSGATLVLVGDAKQLQPIEAGGPFAEMQRRLGAATLQDIRRQREEWARDAVKDFAAGRADQGLEAFASRGLLTVEKDRKKAMKSLISAWKEQGIEEPQNQMILAGTRQEASILNRMAQEVRMKAGCLQGEGIAIPGTNEQLYEGDRVLFTSKSRMYRVENGSLGKVIETDPLKNTVTVRLDNDEHVHFCLSNYSDIRPGYAMTTHKGQGATTERSFILAGGSMQDREITYVQASRSRAETRIFIDEVQAGEDLTDIVRQMKKSRQKEMAHLVEAKLEVVP
jgi:conjugative relaxase-like TrwC/TraI family protein